jgi:hypothetical protein
MEYIVILVVAALIGLIPAKIARSKGYTFSKWWVYGFLLFIVAIIHACMLKPKTASTGTGKSGIAINTPAGDTKKCPYCAEPIKAEATFCRFCDKELPIETVATSPEVPPGAIRSSDTAPRVAGKAFPIKGVLVLFLCIGLIIAGILMIKAVF